MKKRICVVCWDPLPPHAWTRCVPCRKQRKLEVNRKAGRKHYKQNRKARLEKIAAYHQANKEKRSFAAKTRYRNQFLKSLETSQKKTQIIPAYS